MLHLLPFLPADIHSCIPPCCFVCQAKLAELQDLVMRLVAERNDWYSRYAGAVAGAGTVNPDLLPVGQDHTHPDHQVHTHTELNAVGGAGRLNQSCCIAQNHLDIDVVSRGFSEG